MVLQMEMGKKMRNRYLLKSLLLLVQRLSRKIKTREVITNTTRWSAPIRSCLVVLKLASKEHNRVRWVLNNRWIKGQCSLHWSISNHRSWLLFRSNSNKKIWKMKKKIRWRARISTTMKKKTTTIKKYKTQPSESVLLWTRLIKCFEWMGWWTPMKINKCL